MATFARELVIFAMLDAIGAYVSRFERWHDDLVNQDQIIEGQTGGITLEERINEIIEKYHSSRAVILSGAYTDGGTEGGLHGMGMRLARAAGNHVRADPASQARYGIWANTVRDHVLEAISALDQVGADSHSIQKLRSAANSLSAFADIQALFESD